MTPAHLQNIDDQQLADEEEIDRLQGMTVKSNQEVGQAEETTDKTDEKSAKSVESQPKTSK